MLVIGSLWFTFGGDKYFVTEKCMMGPGFLCKDFRVDEGSIQLKVKNSQGKNLGSILFNHTDCSISSDNPKLKNGEENLFTVSECGFEGWSVFEDDVTFEYSFEGSTILHTKPITITSLVEGGDAQSNRGGGSGNGYGADGATLLLYKFDEGDGSIVKDESSNKNDGTHYGNTNLLLHFDGDVLDYSGTGIDGVMNNFENNNVLLLHFDGNYSDSSGNGYGGVCSSGDCPTFVKGISGQALSFDGLSGEGVIQHAVDWFSHYGGSSYPLTIKTMTVSYWINVQGQDEDWDDIIRIGGSHPRTELGVVGKNEVNFCVDASPPGGSQSCYLSGTNSINFGQWHHVVYTYDSDIEKPIGLYIDGEYLGNGGASNYGDILINGQTVSMAREGANAQKYNGYLDELGIYNRVLKKEEVKELYGSKKVKKMDGFITTDSRQGLVLDGVDDYVDYGLNFLKNEIGPSTEEFSVVAILNWDEAQANNPIAYSMFLGQDMPYFNYRSDGRIMFSFLSSGQQRVYSSEIDMRDKHSEWHNLAFTFDSNAVQDTAKILLDGAEVQEQNSY
ncbi:MAG TPA: LamG domain-containing protein, partial [Candidatus Marinimicrobia bacterium]|nr:LamG domain-containing protein [Candidatus Neomarinimicrobiota bacterium]